MITLGIIGVVAALTIPTLIQNYKKQVATVKLKKFCSVMEQAIKLSEIDNGPFYTWKKEKNEYNTLIDNNKNASDEEKQSALDKDREHVTNYFNTYLKSYLKTINVDYEYERNSKGRAIAVYLADGSVLYTYNGGCTDIIFDMNGQKKPNVMGKDQITFLICSDSNNNIYYGFNDNQPLKPYVRRNTIIDSDKISREKLLNLCKQNGYYCAGLLMYDNWEFKDDYPYKL